VLALHGTAQHNFIAVVVEDGQVKTDRDFIDVSILADYFIEISEHGLDVRQTVHLNLKTNRPAHVHHFDVDEVGPSQPWTTLFLVLLSNIAQCLTVSIWLVTSVINSFLLAIRNKFGRITLKIHLIEEFCFWLSSWILIQESKNVRLQVVNTFLDALDNAFAKHYPGEVLGKNWRPMAVSIHEQIDGRCFYKLLVD